MKKLLFAAVVFLLATTINAQEIRFGVKGGLNIGSYKAEFDGETTKTSSKASFYFGGRAEYGFSENASIQGELLFQSYGGKFEETGYEENITVREFSVPIVLKYYVVPQKLSFNAGLATGFIISAKMKWEDTAANESGTEDIKKMLKTLDLGVSLGLEYRFTDNIFSDFRYNIGLNNLYDGDGGGTVKCNVLQIGIGYRF